MSTEQPPIDNSPTKHSSADATLISAETLTTHIHIHQVPENVTAPKQPISIDIGDTIKNRFVLDDLLGKGGMGCVYRALDLRKKEAGDNKPYIALKLLGDDFKHHPHALITLQREARKTQELAHPNIVTVYDFDRDGDLIYLTMEELKGKSLDELLADSTIALTLKQKLDILQQIAQGLAYAHSKGIVHSDLKPANIFITDKNVVKILDFGIARAANADAYEDHFDAGKLGAVTFAYGSLEMLNFEAPHTSDDIYALGIIACELIGKEHPYQRQNAQQVLLDAIAPKIPALTNPLLRKLLQKSIAIKRIDRIQHANDFLKKLKFARKGIKTTIGIATIAAIALAANFIYWHYFAVHEVKFSDLPIAAQQEFKAHIKEAETAMSFDDLQGAVVSIDQAYKIHQSQKELIKLRNKVVNIISTNLTTANTELEREFYQQQLKQLKAYPAFSNITE